MKPRLGLGRIDEGQDRNTGFRVSFFPPSVTLIDVYIDVFCYYLKYFEGEI